jgi:hypothetical protein
VQGTPRRRAPMPRPAPCRRSRCTHRERGAGAGRNMAFAAPRSLNEPIGWRFSSLSQISPLRRAGRA